MEEVFHLDSNWEKSTSYRRTIYNYTGSNLNSHLVGLTTMTNAECNGITEQCGAFYKTGQTTGKYFIDSFTVGISGYNPVINLYKSEIDS